MSYVNLRTRQFCQHTVANDIDVLSGGGHSAQAEDQRPTALVHDTARTQRRILAMINYGQIESTCILHGTSHHSGRRYGASVIRDSDYSCILHLSHFSEFFATTPFCNCANRK